MEQLEYFKRQETSNGHRAGVLITATPGGTPAIRVDLLQFCLAWQGSGARLELPEDLSDMPTNTEQAAWLWLWDYCSVSVEDPELCQDLLDAVALPYPDARILFRQAVANRLIYPDGTIMQQVQDLANRTLTTLQEPS